MSIAVVGLSFGAQSCVIAQAKRGGVDVILNESSQRLNPSIVSYVGNERALGEAGKNQVRARLRARASESARERERETESTRAPHERVRAALSLGAARARARARARAPTPASASSSPQL